MFPHDCHTVVRYSKDELQSRVLIISPVLLSRARLWGSSFVYGNAVYQVKLFFRGSPASPCVQKIPVCVQMDDAGVGVAIGNIHAPIGGKRNIGGPSKMGTVISRLVFYAVHGKARAGLGKAQNAVIAIIGQPQVAGVRIDAAAVRHGKLARAP